jgi:hypothetical protein
MDTYALELNDAGVALVRALDGGRAELLDESPGFALIEQDRVLTGSQAYARWRLRPRFAHNRYFLELSTEPLSRPVSYAQTTADLAYAQLTELLQTHVGRDAELLLAVPAGFSREQLGLLLGVLRECGATVVGVVDGGLAATAEAEIAPRSAHLDLQLHRAVLSVLEHDRHESLARVQYDINPRVGVMSLQQAAMQYIADVFVRKTRFDPLYEAQNEQSLADRLPGLLSSLRTQETIECVIEARAGNYTVELARSGLIAALSGTYQEFAPLIQGALRAHETLPLALSHHFDAWPGLTEYVDGIPAVNARVLPRAAAAFGTLRHVASIRRAPEALALVTRLPAALATDVAVSASLPVHVPAEQQPTHVLFNARAIAITREPLALGWSVSERARALTLPSGVPGLSRSHCTLVRRNGVVVVEDHSTYGSFINDARVQGAGVLKVGDRLRLGAPGVSLELIQLVNDDGTPTSTL